MKVRRERSILRHFMSYRLVRGFLSMQYCSVNHVMALLFPLADQSRALQSPHNGLVQVKK